jgi:AcrR family transcriptional regulator
MAALETKAGTTRRKGDKNRQSIVAAAAELFWSEGFTATSLTQIASAAGVPSGNLFYYFRTKAELAEAVASIFVTETEDMLRSIDEEAAEPRQRLALLVQRLSRSLRSRVAHGCPIALCVRDFRNDAPQASERAATAFHLLIAFIARELCRMAGQHHAGTCAQGCSGTVRRLSPHGEATGRLRSRISGSCAPSASRFQSCRRACLRPPAAWFHPQGRGNRSSASPPKGFRGED